MGRLIHSRPSEVRTRISKTEDEVDDPVPEVVPHQQWVPEFGFLSRQ